MIDYLASVTTGTQFVLVSICQGLPKSDHHLPSLFGIAHDILGFWLLGALGLGLALGLFQFDLFCDTELQAIFYSDPFRDLLPKF